MVEEDDLLSVEVLPETLDGLEEVVPTLERPLTEDADLTAWPA